MSPIDALWHLLGLFLPALATGALAAAAAKGLWRAELKGSRRLAGAAGRRGRPRPRRPHGQLCGNAGGGGTGVVVGRLRAAAGLSS
jgi:hypothetical protein